MDVFRKIKTKLNKKSKTKSKSKTKTSIPCNQNTNQNPRPTLKGFSSVCMTIDLSDSDESMIFDEPKLTTTKEFQPQYNINYELPKDLVQNEFYLPDVGDNFDKTLDLNNINKELIALKSNVFIAEDLIRQIQFNIDDEEIKEIDKIIKKVMYLASRIHHTIMYVQLNKELNDDESEMYEYLVKELSFQIMKISNIKCKFNTTQRNYISNTIKTIQPDITEDEINMRLENSLNDDEETCMLFAKKIIADKYKRMEANLALEFAKEQRKELMEIERSVAILHQMSIDLAQLVNGHTEILDKLEEHIDTAVKYSGKGLQLLQVAESSKLRSRKKKIITGVLIAVVAGVAIITVIGIGAGVLCLMG
jgi:t-SNARE complex subunit (syntaxin)